MPMKSANRGAPAEVSNRATVVDAAEKKHHLKETVHLIVYRAAMRSSKVISRPDAIGPQWRHSNLSVKKCVDGVRCLLLGLRPG